MRKNFSYRFDKSEYIYIKLIEYLLISSLFKSRQKTVTCIVYKNIYLALIFNDGIDSFFNTLCFCNVYINIFKITITKQCIFVSSACINGVSVIC